MYKQQMGLHRTFERMDDSEFAVPKNQSSNRYEATRRGKSAS